MNYIYFLIQKNKERFGTFLMYTILIGLFTAFFGFTLGNVSYEQEGIKLLKDMENCCFIVSYSDEGVFYNESVLYDEDELYNETPFITVDKLPKKDDIIYDAGIFRIDEVWSDADILSSSQLFASHINWNLAEGKGFTDNPNEVILLGNKGYYQIGDIIEIKNDDGEIICQCEVVGINRYPVFLEENGNIGTEYDEYDDFVCTIPFAFVTGNYRNGVDGETMFLNPKNALAYEYGSKNVSYIFTTQSDISDKKDAFREFEEYGELNLVSELQKRKMSFWDMDTAILDVCLLIIFICGVIVHNYLSIVRNQREYGIYYMLGMSWNKLVVLLSLQNIFAFVCGFLLGSSFVYRASLKVDILFIWKNQFGILAGVLGIYLISIIPILLKMRKLDPVELIIKEE
ncbi:MAG: ABC transporter permease [Lachnospiraceae bacterium]|nr:ABC transporter permease [Lachnospiraceae bacterium]